MTVAENAKYIGRRGFYPNRETLQHVVIIRDVRFVYGKVQFMLEADSGRGTKWVDADSVNLA